MKYASSLLTRRLSLVPTSTPLSLFAASNSTSLWPVISATAAWIPTSSSAFSTIEPTLSLTRLNSSAISWTFDRSVVPLSLSILPVPRMNPSSTRPNSFVSAPKESAADSVSMPVITEFRLLTIRCTSTACRLASWTCSTLAPFLTRMSTTSCA